MEVSSGSNFILSDSAGDEELSFTASASNMAASPAKNTHPSPKKTKGPRDAPTATLLPSWASAMPSTGSSATRQRVAAVSFEAHQNKSYSGSFTMGLESVATESASSHSTLPPLVKAEVEHVMGLEQRRRNFLLDEESTLFHHLKRMEAADQIHVEGLEKEKKAERLRSTPLDTTTGTVAPIMVRYVEYLQKIPDDNALAKIQEERTMIANEMEVQQRAAQRLNDEVAARKAYTNAVKVSVSKQMTAREAEMHAKAEQAAQSQKQLVSTAAASKRRAMDDDRDTRLAALHYRLAFMKAHGDYEARVAAGDEVRVVRLSQVEPKVVTAHDTDERKRTAELEAAIKRRGETRRAEAEALAAKQQQLLQERVKEMEQLEAQRRALDAHLSHEADAEMRAALKKRKDAELELEAVEREKERAIFLNRMTCNQDFNLQVERLRQERQAQEKQRRTVVQAARKEKQSAATEASQLSRLNEGKHRSLDRMMSEEALSILKAEDRMRRRGAVESEQSRRLALMEREEANKFKVLEALYSNRDKLAFHADFNRHTNRHSVGALSEDPLLATELGAAKVIHADEVCDRTSAAPLTLQKLSPQVSPQRATAARRQVDQELEKQKKVLAQNFPAKRAVVADKPAKLGPPPSLAYPTVTLLKQPPTSNPRILELAARLHELENQQRQERRHLLLGNKSPARGSSPANRSDSAMSRDERIASQRRLTERSAAQDAQKFAYVPARIATIHDHVQSQSGAPPRLLAPLRHAPTVSPSPSPSPQRKSADQNDPGAEAQALRTFVNRFYSEPVRVHDQVHRACVTSTLSAIPMRRGPRLTDKEVRNVVERLHHDDIRHLSPVTESRMRDAEHRAELRAAGRMEDRIAVERFYASQVDQQRSTAKALDEKYRIVSPYAAN